MKIKWLLIVLLAAGLFACASKGAKQETAPIAYSGTGTLVIDEVSFGKDAYVRDAVQRECELPSKLTQFIKEYAAGQYASIDTAPGNVPADAQVLKIEILNMMASGGGAWSGPKMVEVKGTLSKNGKTIGDFRGRRTSGGGFFGEYKGTCSILGRCVKALGKDIADWLQHPTSNAMLGEM
jgi:type IV pilus biogenesis protein CpaD/CtpE